MIRSMPKLNRIFIVGFMHSGTTLLQNIIASHSAVFTSKGETKFFQYLDYIKKVFPLNDKIQIINYIRKCFEIILGAPVIELDIRYRKAKKFNIDYDDVLAIYDTINIEQHEHIFVKVFDYMATKQNKIHWLEKTPTHVFNLDYLVTIPNVRLINIIRDPRAILSSKKRRQQTVYSSVRYKSIIERNFKYNEKTYHPIWDTISWKSAVNSYEMYKNHILSVKYEDLVSEPDKVILDICNHLDLKYDPQLLSQKMTNPASDSLIGKSGISTASISSFKSYLSKKEMALIQKLTKYEMEKYNYKPIKTLFTDNLLSLSFYLTSIPEFFSRLYKRYKMGGVPYLVQILSTYWLRAKKSKIFS